MIRPLVNVSGDFPILSRQINGHPLVWLDSAATSQKPESVIGVMDDFYRRYNANVLRSVHTLADEATTAFVQSRVLVAQFIRAAVPEEVVFTRGTTESVNMVARAWGDQHVQAGDEIVLSPMEHHSNLIPWQQLARRRQAVLRYVELADDGTITEDAMARVVGPRTRIVALSKISNVLGTFNPVAQAAELAHAVGAALFVDAAQSAPHEPTDVQTLGADFVAFSGHKMLGPTGIGVLWARRDWLERMDPVIFGGEMISYVDRETATWAELPQKFEGGTPNIAGAIGLGAAVQYLQQVGMAAIDQHSRALGELAFDALQGIEGVRVYGPRRPHAATVAFNIEGVHPHDVAQILDSQGVAIRAGHHCAQPLMQWLGIGSAARASFYLYNGEEDVQRLTDAIIETKRFFRR